MWFTQSLEMKNLAFLLDYKKSDCREGQIVFHRSHMAAFSVPKFMTEYLICQVIPQVVMPTAHYIDNG